MTEKTQEQPQTEILKCIDKLNELFYRIGFVSSGCAQSTDWIDDGAATELCLTVNSIQSELGEVIECLNIARKGVCL